MIEGYVTDTIYSTVTSFEWYNVAQLFIGIKSKYRKSYGIKSESGCPDALLYFSAKKECHYPFTRYNKKIQTSELWTDYFWQLWAEEKFIEPYHPDKRPLETEMAHWKMTARK